MSRIMGLQEVKHMEIDTQRVIELVKSVRPLFGPREGVQDNGKRGSGFCDPG